jgi:methionyl-tRNA formyltransferase
VEESIMSDGLDGAVLLSGPALDNWTARALQRAVTEQDLSITHIVVNDATAAGVAGSPLSRVRRYYRTARQYGAWAPVSAWNTVFDPPEYLESQPLDAQPWADSARRIRCAPEPADGIGNELPDAVVEEVSNVDVVFRFGFGILKGEILTAPDYGVLSFHHGDIRTYRGAPTHVWEFLNDEPTSGVTLQQLTETLDGGRIVVFEPVDITDARTWQEVKRRKFRVSEGMLATAVARLGDSRFSPTGVTELGDLYTTPTARETGRILLKNARGRLSI